MAMFLFEFLNLIWMLSFICEARDESKQIFSQIIKINVKFNHSPIAEESVESAIECCRLCHSNPLCKAVNFLVNKRCEILDDIPLDPNTLVASNQSQYWEKTCQPPFGVTAAVSYKVLESVIYAGWGLNIYNVKFNSSLCPTDISFLLSTDTQLAVSDIALMTTEYGPIILMEYGDGWTTCKLLGSPCPGPGTWPKQLVELTNGSRVWALLPKRNSDGIYVFSYDKVIEVSTLTVGAWPIINTYDLDDSSTNNIWRHVPKGIIAATWIKQSSPDLRYAFLLTNDYYIVFDAITHTVIHRGHLCQPGL